MPFSQRIHHLTARIAVLVLLAVFSPMCRLPARAWSYHTHRKVVSDALSFLPSEFQARFLPFKELLMKGATDPDMVIKDFMNHVYHVNSRSGHESAFRVSSLCLQAAEQMKQRRPDSEVAYTLGLVAHYVADINQPLHTAGSEADSEESEYHSKFEKDIQSRMTKIPVPVPTMYAPVTDVKTRVREMAEAASKQYGRIGVAYRTGRGVYDVEDVVNAQYAAAVRNVADFWLGIANQGNMPVRLIPPAPQPLNFTTGGQNPGPGSSAFSFQMNPEQAAESQKRILLDLNTATKDQLMAIPGIGEKRANAILEARRMRPFRSIRDLANITFSAGGKKAFNVNLIERLDGLVTVK